MDVHVPCLGFYHLLVDGGLCPYPVALLSWEHFKGIWGIGEGTISYEAAEHHAPTWLEKDVIRTNLEQRR